MIWLLLAFVFVLFQGFFSGMETGMVSVLRPRAEHAAKNLPDRRCRIVLFFLNHSGVMISTTLLGVNLSVVLASLCFKRFVESLGITGGFGIALSTLILSLLMLTAEIIPKNWFRQSPFERVLKFVPILYATYFLLYPVVRAFAALTAFLDRVLSSGKDAEKKHSMKDDFRLFVRESVGFGTLDEGTASILNRVMTLPNTKLSGLCIPVERAVAIPSTATIAEAFETARLCNLDKLPICRAETARDPEKREFTGIFLAYDAIINFDEKDWPNHSVTECMGPVRILPENDLLLHSEALTSKKRVDLFVITDEAGRHTAVLYPEKIAEILFE